jgi:citronellol/citronellal dehydrogenase
VVVAGRRAEPLEETASLVSGGACEPVVADIREEDDVSSLVDGVLERHGQIDLLVNNAGGQYMSPAEDITPKGFRTVVRLNLEGTWLMTHAVATRGMIPSGRGGKIVNVTLSPHHGLPGMVHSSAARAAVENMTRVLSIEWARFGIRVTAIATGHFETEAIQKYPEPVRRGVATTVPLQRLGQPEEQAWLVAFLASPAGDYYSGAIITLDGARDNWLGPWPPAGLTDEEGNPLAEERRPKDSE